MSLLIGMLRMTAKIWGNNGLTNSVCHLSFFAQNDNFKVMGQRWTKEHLSYLFLWELSRCVVSTNNINKRGTLLKKLWWVLQNNLALPTELTMQICPRNKLFGSWRFEREPFIRAFDNLDNFGESMMLYFQYSAKKPAKSGLRYQYNASFSIWICIGRQSVFTLGETSWDQATCIRV